MLKQIKRLMDGYHDQVTKIIPVHTLDAAALFGFVPGNMFMRARVYHVFHAVCRIEALCVAKDDVNWRAPLGELHFLLSFNCCHSSLLSGCYSVWTKQIPEMSHTPNLAIFPSSMITNGKSTISVTDFARFNCVKWSKMIALLHRAALRLAPQREQSRSKRRSTATLSLPE